jgi:HAD superfamily hydrolase (TIGR01509 family)
VFPVIIYSHRERVLKPERRAFELVLKKLGVAPEEAIMVDDCQENLDAAKAIGMHAVLYRTLDNLQKQLELHGARA